MIAPWLKAHLEKTGHWNADGISRKAKLRKHTCGRYVVVGLDSPVAGVVSICDPDPVTPVGEALALLSGRSSYALHNAVGKAELDHRGQFHIAEAAGTSDYDVVVQHRCEDQSLAACTMPSAYDKPTTKGSTNEPPF